METKAFESTIPSGVTIVPWLSADVIIECIVATLLNVGIIFAGFRMEALLKINTYTPAMQDLLTLAAPITKTIGVFGVIWALLEHFVLIPIRRGKLNSPEAREEWAKIMGRAASGWYRNPKHLMSALGRYDRKWKLKEVLLYKSREKHSKPHIRSNFKKGGPNHDEG